MVIWSDAQGFVDIVICLARTALKVLHVSEVTQAMGVVEVRYRAAQSGCW